MEENKCAFLAALASVPRAVRMAVGRFKTVESKPLSRECGRPKPRPRTVPALAVAISLAFAVLLTTFAVLAADPGHGATVIATGTFESGNYSFPENLNVSDNLTVWGNVGIGTASPDGILHIETPGAGNLVFNTNAAGAGTAQAGVQFEDNGVLRWEWIKNTLNEFKINRYDASGVFQDQPITVGTAGLVTILNELSRSGGSTYIDTTSQTHVITATNDGNVGIGNTTPASTLMVNGTFSVMNSSGTQGLYQDSDGDVGVGTTAPSDKLEIWGNESNAALKVSYGVNRYLQMLAQQTQVNFYSNSGVEFLRYDANAVVVSLMPNNNGNVGIGTASPGAKLEVNGGVRMNTTTSKPTCDATQRGTMWYEQSGAGVDDYLYVCMKSDADTYSWVMVARGS